MPTHYPEEDYGNVLRYPRVAQTKEMCRGCAEDCWNTYPESECWHFEKATVVDKWGGFEPNVIKRSTLSCWHTPKRNWRSKNWKPEPRGSCPSCGCDPDVCSEPGGIPCRLTSILNMLNYMEKGIVRPRKYIITESDE